MNSEQITAFLQEHWNWVTLADRGHHELELALRPYR